jgi:hypothetical protein
MPKPVRALEVSVSENGESSTIIVIAPPRLKTALSRRDSPPLMTPRPQSVAPMRLMAGRKPRCLLE